MPNRAYWSPEEIENMVPPVENGRESRSKGPKGKTFTTSSDAAAGEPPVRLSKGDRRVWDGETYCERDGGSVDRSTTLYWIACGVARGLRGSTLSEAVKVSIIAEAVEDRDRALGFGKFNDRPLQYQETAARALAEVEIESASWGASAATRTAPVEEEPVEDQPPPSDEDAPPGGSPSGRRKRGKGKRDEEDDQGAVKRLSDAILAADCFAVDAGGALYHYAHGTYKRYGDRFVKRRVQELLEAWEETAIWSKHLSNEVVEYVSLKSPELWKKPPTDEINVENGILNLLTRKLHDHTPEFLSPVRIPVRFDSDAKCEAWDKYAVPAFPDDAPELVFEIAADLIAPARSEQKAILMVGEGNNGKSTALTALKAFVGGPNCTGMSLQRIESDRFSVARLFGKLANICPDLPSARLSETSMFKSITGGDRITGEYKYKEGFEFEPFCRLVFSANQVPRSEDATYAFFRRWLVVPFEKNFEGPGEISREVLDAKLAEPAELSGVLNRALDMLERLRKSGFTESETMRDAWAEFRELTDPVSVWLDKATVETPNAYISRGDLLDAYNRSRQDAGQSGMTAKMFGQALKRLRPHLEQKQRTYKGVQKTWCWIGIALRQDGDDGSGGDGGGDGGAQGPGSRFGNNGGDVPGESSPDSPDSLDHTNCFVFDETEPVEGSSAKINNKGDPVNLVNPVTRADLDLEALSEQQRFFVRRLVADGMSQREAIREITRTDDDEEEGVF